MGGKSLLVGPLGTPWDPLVGPLGTLWVPQGGPFGHPVGPPFPKLRSQSRGPPRLLSCGAQSFVSAHMRTSSDSRLTTWTISGNLRKYRKVQEVRTLENENPICFYSVVGGWGRKPVN